MKHFNASNQFIGTVDFDVTLAVCIIAQIQLATRFPGNIGPSRQIAEGFARELQKMIAAVAPENSGIMEMGWDPNFDV